MKALLFDFDGTLADTMPAHFEAWKKAFAEEKIVLLPEEYYPLEGMKVQEVARILSEKHALPENYIQNLVKCKEIFFKQAVTTVSFYPGAYELLSLLRKQNYKLALVTAAQRTRLEETTPLSFLALFDTIITGDDVTEGKPSPEPYTLALTRLSLTPQEAIVIENAPLGISSARAAGIYCVAISSTVAPEKLTEAQVIVPTLQSVYSALFP